MKRSLVLAAAALAAIGAVGCTSRPLQSVFHRGAPCGATPIVGDVTTTYSGCGMPDCPTCGTMGGMPVLGETMVGGGYIVDPPMPTPGQ